MNVKQLFLALIFIFPLVIVCGQNATLKGTVTDQQTEEALIAATVKAGNTGAITDFSGNYSLSLPPGTYTISISYVGYQTYSLTLDLAAGETRELSTSLDPQSTMLQEATVTSGKFEKALGEVTVSLEILKPDLIESTSKKSIDEALQKVPGVTIIDGQANIRGGSGFSQGAGSRVLLLVDDIPILQADAGYPNWDDVPIENISQVEVVKGAASALYGSSALNGIVNVRTAYPKAQPETKVAAFYTTYFDPKDPRNKWWDTAPSTYMGSVSHKRKIGDLDLVVGGFYLDENSFRKDTYKRYGRFNTNTRYRITDRLSVGVNANFNKGKSGSYFYWASDTMAYVGAPSTIGTRERNRYNIDPFAIYFDPHGNRHRVTGRFYNVQNDNSDNQSNYSRLYYGEYQFQRKFAASDIVFSAGLVGSGTKVDAQLYGDTTFSSRNLAGYLQFDKEFFDRLNFSAGFRYEDNLLINPGFTFAQGEVDPSRERESKPVFRFGLNYQAAEYTYLRASWGQGYRFPTVAEKFIYTNAGGFFIVPNPALQSETGWSAEVAIKQGFKVGGFEGFIDLSGFIMRYQDMMEFNVDGFNFRSVNIGDTEITGFEVSIAGRGSLFGLPTTLLAGYTYIDPRFKAFDTTPIAPGEPVSQGQRNANNSSSEDPILKYRSKHTVKFDVETNYKGLSLGWESFYNSQIEAIDAVFLLIIRGLARYRENHPEGAFVNNARLAYRFSDKFKISLLMGNVFNAEYVIRPGLLEGPRNLTLRTDVKF